MKLKQLLKNIGLTQPVHLYYTVHASYTVRRRNVLKLISFSIWYGFYDSSEPGIFPACAARLVWLNPGSSRYSEELPRDCPQSPPSPRPHLTSGGSPPSASSTLPRNLLSKRKIILQLEEKNYRLMFRISDYNE